MSETIEDKIFSEKNGNFQTMNMIYKIKNVKKKRKQPENMKNIPFPEVLNNVEPFDSLKETKSESLPPIKEGFDAKGASSFFNNAIGKPSAGALTTAAANIKKKIERFKFDKDEWEGYDNVSDIPADMGGKDPRQLLIDFINYVYNSTIAYNKLLAGYIADKVSNTKATNEINKEAKKEISVLKKSFGADSTIEADTKGDLNADKEKFYIYICIIEALTFSCFVVNNWFFLIYYNNFELNDDFIEGGRVKLTDFSVDMFKGLPDSVLTNRVIKNGFLYFFEYALFFPVTFQWFLLKVVPKTTVKWFNHMLLYIILFFVTFCVSYYMIGGLKDFLIDCINGNMKNIFVSMMLVAVVILFLVPDPDSEASMFNHNYDKRRQERDVEKDRKTMESVEIQTIRLRELAKELEALDLNNPTNLNDPIKANRAIAIKKEIDKINGKGNWFTPGLQRKTEKIINKYGFDRNEIERLKREKGETQEQVDEANRNRQQQQSNQTGGYSDLDIEIDGGDGEEDGEGEGTGPGEPAQERSNYDKAKEQLGNLKPKSKAAAAQSILKIIWNCIRFLIVITISVPFGAIFCAAYFVFYSLYAMVYYYDRDFTKIMAAFIDMLQFIDNKKEENNARPEDTTFQLCVKKFYEYLEYISDNFFIIVYLITFFILLGDSQKNISNNTFRNTLYFIDLSFIFIILSYLYYIIKSRFNISSINDMINIANGSVKPGEKNYNGSASAFNMANYGVYGLTMASVFYVFWSLVQYNLPKSMQFV
uniref:Uncharacterized protein n=1 Tax=viral metagenome TaxID=1070528 RepID=A0A6C0LC93_9ZZZZ